MDVIKQTKSIDNFSVFSHRGFGEKTYARYADMNKLRFVHNQLTGLELGTEKGADVLELDLSKTKDGKIVTEHGNPLRKYLPFTEKEFLDKYPEALTFQELLDWHYHTAFKVELFLELKSPISLHELLAEIKKYAKNNPVIIKQFFQHVLIYAISLSVVKNLINEKKELELSTAQLRICWVSMNLIDYHRIDQISRIGTQENRIYGIEQGTILWGSKFFIPLLDIPLFPFLTIKKWLQKLDDIVTYSHKKNLIFIIGGIDDIKVTKMVLMKNINGIVPDNPLRIYDTGIIKNMHKVKMHKQYIPLSMKQRLNLH